MSNPPVVTAYPAEARSTSYLPYRGLFDDSSAAREHRHFSTRFGRHPHIDPAEDATIKEVEDARKHHVGRIYDAMISGDRAQDNAGSIAVKRWVTGAHYKSDLVEAFAHKILDCLLVQVKEGFRGWGHNDYAEDDRKAVADDKEIDCMGRLDNIIEALEREKTICEDVVNSACQIRMFVNAPIAYAARKEQNRIGNSKRGRTRDPSLASNDLLFPQQVWADTLTPTQAVDSPHGFDQHQPIEHVSLADVEHISPRALDGNLGDPADFESFWNEQPGVQPFSFHHPSNQGYDQH
ncbi:hypothetical protein SLS59_003579 [Nothophoma quercina]|uniref:Uncharacterized protein n=1 Tax=Nothophoma quercina TaxID=749835 RepID=A0ABR3RMX5_9PLEO